MNLRSFAEMCKTSPSPRPHHTSRPHGFRHLIAGVWDLNNSLVYQNFQPLLLDFLSNCWPLAVNWAFFALRRLAAKCAPPICWQRLLHGRTPPARRSTKLRHRPVSQRSRTALISGRQAARGIASGCAPAGNATSLCTDPNTGTVMGVLSAGSSRD